MHIIRSRQLPDGEELVWAETTETPGSIVEPGESARERRRIALAEAPVSPRGFGRDTRSRRHDSAAVPGVEGGR